VEQVLRSSRDPDAVLKAEELVNAGDNELSTYYHHIMYIIILSSYHHNIIISSSLLLAHTDYGGPLLFFYHIFSKCGRENTC